MPKKIVFLLILGLLVRLFISYFQYSGDVNNHLVWADGFIKSSTDFFTRHFPGFNDANYPPLAIYLFAASRLLYLAVLDVSKILNTTLSVFPSALVPFLTHSNTQIAFMKLSPIIADIGIAALIYLLTQNKFKTLMMSLFLFNPAVIYLSAVWGQIEALPIFFCLLSIYLFQRQSRFALYLSQLSFLLAILSKQTALWLLPVFLIMWLKKTKIIDFLKSSFVTLIAYFVIFVPFINWNHISALTQPVTIYLSTLSGSTQLANDQVWNLWNMIYGGVPTLDSDMILFLSIRTLSFGLIVLSLIYICYRYVRKSSYSNLYLSFFLLSLVMFFIQTRVHEKHLFPALPFFLLLSGKKLSLTLLVFIGLSIFFYLNLYTSLGLPFI